MKKIKEAGKGDTNSHEKIPEASEQKIIELLVTLQAIMEIKEKNSEEYQALVEKLPTVYRDTYHKLIQKGMQFIFMSLLAKRGREGIDKVEKLALNWPPYMRTHRQRVTRSGHILSPVCE